MTEIANTLVGNCIEGRGSRNPAGYGRLRHNGKMVYAHRLAYVEHHGLPLEDIDGLVVRHRCDNPPCCNPDHLELGTHADNSRDMVERGRARSGLLQGAVNGMARLTEQDVLSIRAEYVAGCRENGGVALARKYGVSQPLVSALIARKRWAHI